MNRSNFCPWRMRIQKMIQTTRSRLFPRSKRTSPSGVITAILTWSVLPGLAALITCRADGGDATDSAAGRERTVRLVARQAEADRVQVPPSPLPTIKESDSEVQELDWQTPDPERYTIDLTTALQLATSVNPRIGLAHESVREALAFELGARALLLPTMTAGTNYHFHTGQLQTSFGLIRTINEQSVYFGGGARTLAAETVAIPAVRLFAQLGDAIYAPLAAVQVVAERNATAHAVTNLTLLDVVTGYMLLSRAETKVEALRLSLEDYREVVRLTKAFAIAGQGRDADFHRSRSHSLLMVMELQRAEEEAAVASSELARLLRLDQSVQLESPSAPLELVVLTPLDTELNYLVDIAQARRPEVRANGAAIGAADARVRQEVMRPWLPTLSLGFSAGGFGGGSNQTSLGVDSMFQRTAARTDFNFFAFWQLQNMGAGNRSLQEESRASRDEAIYRRALTLNIIRREVSVAHASLQSARQRLVVSQVQLAAAERGAEQSLNRIRGGVGLPIEVLNSLDLLTRARLDLVDAATAFNIAQFALFVSLGETPVATP